MGTNRRYGSDLTDKAINAVLVRPKPLSLTEDEKKSTGEAVQQPSTEDAPQVLAWVRYPEWTVQVAGRVVAYNDRMVLVEWETQGGGTHQAWVWRSAVTIPKPVSRSSGAKTRGCGSCRRPPRGRGRSRAPALGPTE